MIKGPSKERRTIIAAPSSTKALTSEADFKIGETLTVVQAALVYAGRHPRPNFLKGGTPEDVVKFLRAGSRSPSVKARTAAKRGTDIYFDLLRRIEDGEIRPVKRHYLALDDRGELDPIRTKIRTVDLYSVAMDRGELTKFLMRLSPERSMAETNLTQKRQLTMPNASKVAVEFIENERNAGRKPSLKKLEAEASEKYIGGRKWLRDAFKKKMALLGLRVHPGRPTEK
jgi:hypothetical protein